MENKKKNKINTVLYIILIGFILLMFLPATRSYLQQGLMKLGLFKPDLEAPVVVEEKNADSAATPQAQVVFSDAGGKQVDVATLKGKVVFMNFWATWCPPCRDEMPSIQVLYNQLKDSEDIVFMMVEIDHEAEKAVAFMEKEKLSLPIYYPETAIPKEWVGQSIPVTVILDKEGNIAARHEGMADYSTPEVLKFVTDLINK